jgi:hypothetical protein
MNKKMIKTVISQLPPLIQHYPKSDQVLLNNFLDLLKYFEEADYKRSKLISRLTEYTNSLQGAEIYLQTPFLWFTKTYFQNAQATLTWATFRADPFYRYLSRYLHHAGGSPGVFELLRKHTKLENLEWEQLQYTSNKIQTPLSTSKLNLIESIFSIVENEGIYSLNSRILKRKLKPYFSKKSTYSNELKAFFSQLESRWNLNFHPPGFGLEKIFIQLQLLGNQIDKIIPFQEANSTLMRFSDIYYSRDENDTYFGIVFVPTQDKNLFFEYLKEMEQKGLLKISRYTPITSTHRSISLEKYKADTGWISLTKGQRKKQIDLLKSKIGKNMETKKNLHYFSPSFNEKWYFTQHQLPLELIRIYCNLSSSYSYNRLPFTSFSNKEENSFTKETIGLLKQLNYNNNLNIDWIPLRLVYEFSLDYYWIITPKFPLPQLTRFLEILPYSVVHLAEDQIILFAYLTPQLAQWMSEDLNWEIHFISRLFSPVNLHYEWFNEDKMQWETPLFLRKRIKK